MEVIETPRRRRRAWIWVVSGVLLVVLVAGAGLAARRPGTKAKKKGEGESTPAAPVELSAVREGGIATYLQNTAVLEARNTAMLVARRQGQVMALLAEEGQAVKRGQPLVRLDDREAALAVQRAELVCEVAKREVDRGRQMHDKGYLSEKESDDLELKMRTASVELEQARLELSERTILAPFAGRVVERRVQLGETVTVGKELYRLSDFDPLLARVFFPERELARVRVGQPATFTLDAQPGRALEARVSLVNPEVDRSNGTFKVTLEVANPGGVLRPGAFAHVKLRTGEFPNALLLPRRGVLSEDGEDYVFIARGDSVVRAPVRVGAVEGDQAQILHGLSPGDRVVTVGQGGLKPGTKIKPVAL